MREYITGDTPCVVYIVHFDRPIGNPENSRAQAQHYLGSTLDLPRRILEHTSGRGAAIMRAVAEQQIGFTVYAFHGTPNHERGFKARYKNTRELCPACMGARCRMRLQPITQLPLLLGSSDDEWELPDPPVRRGRFDRFEAAVLAAWRKVRPAAPASNILDLPLDQW
ncbi:MAG TPA: hypothetical protein VFS21_33245 [Roseiflexaceae bacterium]|nr:hypothetical protein [Roseiflexaceae bacterium]